MLRLLGIIALVVIAVLFFTRKSAAAPSATPASDEPLDYNTPPTPGELADLDAMQNYGPVDNGISVSLPGGINFTYHGNPNDFPDITDQNGDPYAIASGRGGY